MGFHSRAPRAGKKSRGCELRRLGPKGTPGKGGGTMPLAFFFRTNCAPRSGFPQKTKPPPQERLAKQYARRALRAIGSANDVAFGARTKQTARRSTGDPDLEAHREATRRRKQQAQRTPLPSSYPSYLGTALQCLFVTPFDVAEQYAMRTPRLRAEQTRRRSKAFSVHRTRRSRRARPN